MNYFEVIANLLPGKAQPLGNLAVYLLEPECEDGLTAWNYFDAHLRAGTDFPVLRVAAPVSLNSERR